ncbi:MAG: helix-turn-helix transcriptional regulator [Oscillospiraceae bacterium]|nr:helix-turn-helix transcriptional regulator [Oscillospiraceae bacterium]
MATLSERLKELRKSRNVTQKQISEYIKTDQRNYRRYEAGITDPTTKFAIRIADFYDVSIDYLVGRSDNPERR